jgi:hypothetical protein
MFPLLLRYVHDVDHVHSLYLERELLLAAIVRPARFVIILAAGTLALFLGCDLAGLFDYPTVTVGVVGWLVRGAVNLVGPIQNSI